MKYLLLLVCFLGNHAFADHHESSEAISGLDNIKANITVTSDYIWRGATQNKQRAVVQGGLDYSHDSGVAIGIWGSNVDGGTEIDFYGSYTLNVNDDLSISPGLTFYHYIYGEDVSNLDTLEYNLNFGIYGFDLSVNYIENYFKTDSSAMYYALGKSFDIAKDLSFGIVLGYNHFDDEDNTGDSFFHYMVSLTKAMNDFEVGVHYSDAVDRDYASGANTDRNLLFSIGYSL